MSVNLNVSDFSADFFTLDQESKPTDTGQFLKGLNLLASRALDALSSPDDVELAFQRIKFANLIELSFEDKTNVDQRIQDVFKNWVKVNFGNHFRHVPRKRLAEQCGPKFQAQYTSVMKEALDRELDLRSADPSSTDSCPEDCKKFFLVYLQTGALPPEALGDDALDMLALAEQHQLEGLIRECLDFLIDNLSIENLGTFLEFTQQTNCPQLELACLNFIQSNRDSISEDLKTKYQEKLSIIEASVRSEIILTISSSGKIEAEVETFTEQTADALQKISEQFPIGSLILPEAYHYFPFSCFEQIAPNLKNLQELIIWYEFPTDSYLTKVKNLFPKLTALGNDAPFFKTFDEVKTYVKNFRKPGEDDQASEQPNLLSLNLRNVPNLTDAQLAELTPYLQELYHLFIKSDKITSVVAPKATNINCDSCTALTTLEAPEARRIDCDRCTPLTNLEAPKATLISCRGCTVLTTLEAPRATKGVYCDRCTVLTVVRAPEATLVNCCNCTALTTLEAPKATRVSCRGCPALTTLEAPKVSWADCHGCTALTTLKQLKVTSVDCTGFPNLTTLEAPKATEVDCSGCESLTTLIVPKATSVNCDGCTALTTLEVPEAIEVHCSSCKALTTLKAPKATRVNCSDCTQLSTLEVPEAIELSCDGCTKLTTPETPVENFIGKLKYILLTRFFISSLWAFLAKASQSCLSLFDSLKSYLQNMLRTQ